ncbi:MAG TPA: hypothetical protein DEB06_07955 [Phycisphaerales bacterium]|nr:hypothetical protein [Phycisphaerales bacterium]
MEVTVERIQRPGRRVGVPSVRLSSYARDPDAEASGEPSWFIVDDHTDEDLASHLAGAIRGRLNQPTEHAANK